MTYDAESHRDRLSAGTSAVCQWCDSTTPPSRHEREVERGEPVRWHRCPDCGGIRWSSRRDEGRRIREEIARMRRLTAGDSDRGVTHYRRHRYGKYI